MVKAAGHALQHGASVFAGDHQSSKKTARHFVLMTVKERTEHAKDPTQYK